MSATTTHCEFSNPVDLGGGDFEFAHIECAELNATSISDGTSTAFILNRIDIGEIFIIFFIILFLGGIIFKFLWNFIHALIVKGKSQNEL